MNIKFPKEENYVKSYYGTDFIGEDKCRELVQKLKILQDALQRRGKDLLVVIAAGKGFFIPNTSPKPIKTPLKP
ncbi:MAG: hypothetical protein LBR51_04640 [Bacteroidales bacterium]|jgi:hypothetical protein|nr:hypothetical protein [Bacteroidales bacterium]